MEYTILAVDDNKIILAMIKHTFGTETQMYSIITADNGKIAYEMAIDRKPDLILMDMDMPVMNGVESLYHLKSNEITKDIPVIMITASKNLKEAFDAGAIDFIHKPIDKTELIVRVKSTLSMFRLLQGIIKQSEELEAEKKKGDALLLNILPAEVADQLKNYEVVKPRHYRKVSVMFTDFMGFTKISEMLSIEELIQNLSVFFEKFDEITGRHFIEKIKTIGDAYMCVGGLPMRNNSNPINTVLAGLEIQKFMEEYKNQTGNDLWKLRLGIHTGEVIAGVIGKKKFAYDIWGDTVNTASRMESSGEGGKVNISGDTFKHIKAYFDCTYRGKIKAKNKGEIDMYFVDRLKAEFSKDEEGIYPNDSFKEVLAGY